MALRKGLLTGACRAKRPPPTIYQAARSSKGNASPEVRDFPPIVRWSCVKSFEARVVTGGQWYRREPRPRVRPCHSEVGRSSGGVGMAGGTDGDK